MQFFISSKVLKVTVSNAAQPNKPSRSSQMSSPMMFYKKPVTLNRDTHRKLRYQAQRDYRFSQEVNSVPLVGDEFFQASRDLSVLFKRDSDGKYFPLALMSLRNNGHDLVSEEGNWTGIYVPAFLRRYPFALTSSGHVCIDEKSTAFGLDEGQALFDKKGSNSEVLLSIVAFLKQYESESDRTSDFCEALSEKMMFKPFNVQITAREQSPVRLDGLFVIDEAVFSRLEGNLLQEWFQKGWVAWIYAHLHSIGTLSQLSDRLNPSAMQEPKNDTDPGLHLKTELEQGSEQEPEPEPEQEQEQEPETRHQNDTETLAQKELQT